MQTPDKKTWTKPELLRLAGGSDSAGGTNMSRAEVGLSASYDPSGGPQ